MKLFVDIIPLFVAVPMAGAFLIALVARKIKWLPALITNIITIGLVFVSFFAVKLINIHKVLVYDVGAWKPPMGIGMVLDGFTVFMLTTVNLAAFFVAIYSINYVERFTSKWKFYTLFLFMIAGANGVVITGDIFNLFVFLEIASIASCSLIAFGTEKHDLEAAFKYAVMSGVGSLFILLSIVLLYSYTSTLNMADISNVLAQKGPNNIILMISALLIMGFGLKAGLVPFHGCLPDAYTSAPAPVSAMLAGAITKSLGLYAIFRIFYNVIGMNQALSSIFMFFGALSMIVGVILAIGQWDFKRLLAYHSISQMGYIVMGIGLGTPLGILGGLFHLFNHSVFKTLLFLNSGSIEYATGKRDLQKMGGLSEQMPVTSGTCLAASMAISGIPPFNGFWSKFIIIIAAVQAGRYGYAFLAVLASILTLASFTKVMKYAFFGKLKDGANSVKEAPFLIKLSMTSLAVICITGGILLAPGVYEHFLKEAVDVILEGTKYSSVVLQAVLK